MRMRYLILLPVLFAAGHASAQEKCYETKTVPNVHCTGGRSNSADFTGECSKTVTQVVEVACPAKPADPQWVNSASTLSHAQACAAHGLRPSSINGEVCASNYMRPQSGKGHGSIVYTTTTGDQCSESGNWCGFKKKDGGTDILRGKDGSYHCYPTLAATAVGTTHPHIRAYACE